MVSGDVNKNDNSLFFSVLCGIFKTKHLFMKKYFLIVAAIFFIPFINFAQNITLTTSPVVASTIAQGTNNNILYAVKMDVAAQPVTVNSMQLTLTGTHDDNDLVVLHVFFNPTAPTVSGATQKAVNVSANFAAPHTYNAVFNLGSQLLAAGTTGYFIVVADVAAAATSGNTIKVNGLTNPVTFAYATSPTITNNQTDIAGIQTILAAAVTLTTSAIAAANITQGTNNNILYAVKMDIAALPVTVNSMQFTLTGTHDDNDLVVLHVYFNPTAPTLSGATQKAVNVSANFDAPHTYNAVFNLGSQGLAAGTSGYFIVVADVAVAATSGNTIKVNGFTNPVTFAYTTSPTITNNQTDIAGIQTILAAGVTLNTSLIAAANIAQGTNNNIVYAVRMDVAAQPVTVNSMQFTLTGTHDDNDLVVLHVFFNPTAPTVSGATQKAVNVSANFAAPHTYNAVFNLGSQLLAAGTTGYFIVVADVAVAATSGNTIKVNGLINPVTFGYTTSPVVNNNQSDIAGAQTILAAGVTLTTSPVAAANIAQGTSNNIIYTVRMDVAALAVTVNSMQFTLTGTHDDNDLVVLDVYFNPTAPTVSGATQKAVNVSANFAAPHTYNAVFNLGSQLLAAGTSGYFIVTVNIAAAASISNTVKINGATNPVTFGYTTSPAVANNQTDAAGGITIIGSLPLSLVLFTGTATHTAQVQLQWKTAQEINTKDFEVEWSTDGLHFTKIGVLPSGGNSTQELSHNYLHKMPADGANYYRLKMQDIDGRFTYSPIIKIIVTTNGVSVTAFPNPVINYLQLEIKAAKNETIVITLHSADGKIIASKQFAVTKGSNLLNWHLQSVSAGSYFISSSNIPLPTIKIIKQ
jgi:hypothetical protein